MVILRMLGGWLLVLGALCAILDATRLMTYGGRLALAPLGRHWLTIHEASFRACEELAQKGAFGVIWKWGLMPFLNLPGTLTLTVLGAALCYAGRRRRRIDVFSN